ncbi:unnamed protein product [Cylicocyclus nassatus]|uniref:G-protein coupled receptors family 1 profile domain-containing protein n=1 Tax=Cylicocyclus nassatus TaxID=53992 RepID=A0AA36DIN6_CYLNA|nr:unnamed protein product [Cylicocyclus nassatus]
MVLSDVDECLANAKRVPDSSRPYRGKVKGVIRFSVTTAFKRPSIAATILFFTLVGVISNLAVLTVFICHWRSTFRSQYFTFFVLNMIIAGIVYCSTNLWVSVPCTINECPFIRSDGLMITMSTPNTWGYWAYLLSSLTFTIYRFGVFMSSSFGERKSCMQMLLILSWLLPIVITLGSTALGCQKRYNRYSLAYTFDCSNCTIFWGFSFLDFNQYAGQSIPLIMITAYAIILFSVYRNRKTHGGFNRQQSIADAKLAFQFIIICCSQYLSTLLFFIIPKVGYRSDWSVLLMNTIGTINVSINPTVLLLWNQQVRSSALVTFGRRQVRTVTEATAIRSVKPV